jgi:solute carrier family 35 (UDP-xylose/UDP-N-acetylglucosamine transporter), member B4
MPLPSARLTPIAGLLITLNQFALTTLLTLPSQVIDRSKISMIPFKCQLSVSLAPRTIPMTTWATYTALFVFVNVLNNQAFGYDISVPVHIILRSGGSVTTMLVGYLVAGKKYSRLQISGVLLLTAGVITAALSDAKSQGKLDSPSYSHQPLKRDPTSFATGLLILLVAQTISAYMGLYIQNIYAALPSETPRPWRENLFYSHFLSLPLFIPFYPAIISQFKALFSSTPISAYLPSDLSLPPSDLNFLALALDYLTRTPIKVFQLSINALTQYACIRGVNVLSARSSALTVTIVLNFRKLVSLLLSIWLFGNELAPGVLVGALIVFVGGGVYGWEGGGKKKQASSNGAVAEPDKKMAEGVANGDVDGEKEVVKKEL